MAELKGRLCSSSSSPLHRRILLPPWRLGALDSSCFPNPCPCWSLKLGAEPWVPLSGKGPKVCVGGVWQALSLSVTSPDPCCALVSWGSGGVWWAPGCRHTATQPPCTQICLLMQPAWSTKRAEALLSGGAEPSSAPPCPKEPGGRGGCVWVGAVSLRMPAPEGSR